MTKDPHLTSNANGETAAYVMSCIQFFDLRYGVDNYFYKSSAIAPFASKNDYVHIKNRRRGRSATTLAIMHSTTQMPPYTQQKPPLSGRRIDNNYAIRPSKCPDQPIQMKWFIPARRDPPPKKQAQHNDDACSDDTKNPHFVFQLFIFPARLCEPICNASR